MEKLETNNKIVILGGGESGVGAAILAKTNAFEVFLSDKGKLKENYKKALIENEIPFEENKHTIEKIIQADEVVVSPGIPHTSPEIKILKEKNIPLIPEIEFAGRYTTAKKICITGSNGKTTTTTLIYTILKQAGLNVGLAGNIGKSFAWQVATEKYDVYVIELSSFQLDLMFNFKAEIAILLNITPDHLDRYDYKFENYIESKFKICRNQTSIDFFIYCADDEVITNNLKTKLQQHKACPQLLPFSIQNVENMSAFYNDNSFSVNTNNESFTMVTEEIKIKGKHNVYNTMAAAITAKLVNIRNETLRESMRGFEGVPHRLELVKNVNGVDYINDSKATNINSVWYALESMRKKVVLILGGIDKGNDYGILKNLVREKVKVIVCLGIDNLKIHKAFDDLVKTVDATSMEEAIQLAGFYATSGDVVLLSPACSSFDLFKNYEDRGDKFKNAVLKL